MEGNRHCPSINLAPSSSVNIDPGMAVGPFPTPAGAVGGINLPQSAIVDLGIGPRVMETLVGARGKATLILHSLFNDLCSDSRSGLEVGKARRR